MLSHHRVWTDPNAHQRTTGGDAEDEPRIPTDWALRFAVLAADMHAFILANPAASLLDFCQWYFDRAIHHDGEGIGTPAEWDVLRRFWMHTFDRIEQLRLVESANGRGKPATEFGSSRPHHHDGSGCQLPPKSCSIL
jgi:hypothetical protein